MAITPAASPDPGRAAPSTLEGTSSEPLSTDAGPEIEAAQPQAASLEPLRAGAPAGGSAQPSAASSADSSIVDPGLSSAGFLHGSSRAVIRDMDAEFARLLDEVHQ